MDNKPDTSLQRNILLSNKKEQTEMNLNDMGNILDDSIYILKKTQP